MDYKKEILLYVKTGAIIAKCDNDFCELEKNRILKFCDDAKDDKKYAASYTPDIENACKESIEYIENLSIEELDAEFYNIINETKQYIDTLDDISEKQELVTSLKEFIVTIIYSDNVRKDIETNYYNKWITEMLKYTEMSVPSTTIKDSREIKDSSNQLPLEQSDNNVNNTTDNSNNESEDGDNSKKNTIWKNLLFWCGIVVIVIGIFISAMGLYNNYKNKEELEAFPLSSYTQKMLQFKEIDFSKVLIYGTETNDPEKDSLLLYFVKGTAVLRFRGLDNLSVDTTLSDEDTLFLNYNMENQTAIPIDIEIIYDESKSRLIDSFESTTLKDSPIGNTVKGITTVAGTAGGAFLGKAIGGMFGMKGKIIGAASGAVLGGVGSYIASSNFVTKTKIVKDNSSATIRDMLEDAKPVIAAQLLSDETVTQNTDKNEIDTKKISKYYRQQLTDILTNIICNDENCKWKNVEIRFDDASTKN